MFPKLFQKILYCAPILFILFVGNPVKRVLSSVSHNPSSIFHSSNPLSSFSLSLSLTTSFYIFYSLLIFFSLVSYLLFSPSVKFSISVITFLFFYFTWSFLIVTCSFTSHFFGICFLVISLLLIFQIIQTVVSVNSQSYVACFFISLFYLVQT